MTENKIKQKSIHSKATRTSYHQVNKCTNTGCSNHNNGGYGDWGNYSNWGNHNNHVNWGIWYDAWHACSKSNSCDKTNSGCSKAWGCGNHTNTGYSDYSNGSYTATEVLYTDSIDNTQWNPQATANKVIVSKAFVNNLKVPTIYLRWATGGGVEIRPDWSGFNRECTAIRFYLETSTTKTFTESNFTLLGEVNATSSSYNWTVSDLATDAQSLYARIGITGYNGSWSALLSNGKLNVQDSHEQMTSGGTNPKITVQSWTDVAASYMLSDIFKIYYYKPPTWLTAPTKETIDQLDTEVNKARGKLDATAYIFADRPVISNFTIMKSSSIASSIAGTKDIVTIDGQGTLPATPAQGDKITNTAIKQLQSILDNMGKV